MKCHLGLYHAVGLQEAQEPGVSHAFFSPAVEKAPVVFSGRWVVGVELDHASLPRGSQRYISNFHFGKFSAMYFS
jgi:hypothetical protein